MPVADMEANSQHFGAPLGSTYIRLVDRSGKKLPNRELQTLDGPLRKFHKNTMKQVKYSASVWIIQEANFGTRHYRFMKAPSKTAAR